MGGLLVSRTTKVAYLNSLRGAPPLTPPRYEVSWEITLCEIIFTFFTDFNIYISCLPSKALDKVTSSAYSS